MKTVLFRDLNDFLWERKDDLFADFESLGIRIIDLGSSGFRFNPCPYCGHNDCCTVHETYGGDGEVTALGKCFSGECNNRGFSFDQLVYTSYKVCYKDPEMKIGQLLDISIQSGKSSISEKERRQQEILQLGIEFYHDQLLAHPGTLEYLTDKRKRKIETIKFFKIGYCKQKYVLEKQLIEKGYTPDEIKQSKIITIPESLLVYPYIENDMVARINTKNPYNVTYTSGDVIAGYSISNKAFYRVPGLKRTKDVVLVEGENDLQSCYEAGTTNVIASGGKISGEQIEELRQYERIYVMTDNDEPGRQMLKTINDSLPEVKVHEVVYDQNFKDPDELFKKSETPPTIKELLDSAVALENTGFRTSIESDTVMLKNSHYCVKFELLSLNNTGAYKGNFNYYEDGKEKDVKLDVLLSKIDKKYIRFTNPLNNALDEFYNGNVEKRDIMDLLKTIKFTKSHAAVIKTIAKKLLEQADESIRNSNIEYIEKHYYSYIDRILKEMNNIGTSQLDPDASYPFMPAAQAFDVINKKAYIYYNMSMVDDNGIKLIPTLLRNDGQTIRLDFYKRKSAQHILIIDKSFQLQNEVVTAIMDNDKVSLKSRFAKKFTNREINDESMAVVRILEDIEFCFKEVFYTEDTIIYKILAIFVFNTYLYQLFGVTPYLFINSEKGSGKSTLSTLLGRLCFCCRLTVGISDAAMFRTISSCGGTLILDEMENLTTRDKTQDLQMASFLKSGYTKNGGTPLRTNLETNRVEEFSLYCPKIISNIYGIEDVLADRCLKIPMKKYPPSLTKEKMDIGVFLANFTPYIEEVTSRACLSALKHFMEIYDKYISVNMDMGSARNSQIMRPLFAIAEFAGEEYVKALKEYYGKYMKSDKDWIEDNSPEGNMKRALQVISDDVEYGTFKWITEEMLRNWCHKTSDDSFETNTFVVKLVLDQLDGQKSYDLPDVHKLLKRVYPDLRLGERTSISIASYPELITMMKNKTKVGVYKLELKFDDYRDKSDKDAEMLRKIL